MFDDEIIEISIEATRTFNEYWNYLVKTFPEVSQTPTDKVGLGLMWLRSFTMGYEFRKRGSIVDKVNLN